LKNLKNQRIDGLFSVRNICTLIMQFAYLSMREYMKEILTRASQILLSLFLMLVLFGCGTPAGSRLYSGALRSRQDVALIMPMQAIDGSLLIRGIRSEKDNKEIDFEPYRGNLELLPGRYSIAVSSSAHSSKGLGIY
jgi:hypothetical protein